MFARFFRTMSLPDADLTALELKTLSALVEHGPLSDCDLPGRVAGSTLVARGLAVRVVSNGKPGHTAATLLGHDHYLMRYGAKTVERAASNRRCEMDRRAYIADTRSLYAKRPTGGDTR